MVLFCGFSDCKFQDVCYSRYKLLVIISGQTLIFNPMDLKSKNLLSAVMVHFMCFHYGLPFL